MMRYHHGRGGKYGTGPLKSLATGFLGMVAAEWTYSSLCLIQRGDAWLGTAYMLIMLMPVCTTMYLLIKKGKAPAAHRSNVEKWASMFFALQGVALACWAYDLTTTFYAIDIARVAVEINPLGWPLGALGAMSYYVPTVLLSYVLLFRLKQRVSLYAAVPVTIVALMMGLMNLNAGAQNFKFYIITAWLPLNMRSSLLAIVLASDLAFAAIFTAAITRKLSFFTRRLGEAKKP
jgi:hypothetical protein